MSEDTSRETEDYEMRGLENEEPEEVSVYLSETIAFLNKMLELDRMNVSRLFETRVLINDSLARCELPIVVLQDEIGFPMLGMIGVLNGLLSTSQPYYLAAEYDTETKDSGEGFDIIQRFVAVRRK